MDASGRLQGCRELLQRLVDLHRSISTRREAALRRRKSLFEPIESRLKLSARTETALLGAGIDTVAELCSKTADHLLQLRNMSEACVEELRQGLAKIGRHLRGEGRSEVE